MSHTKTTSTALVATTETTQGCAALLSTAAIINTPPPLSDSAVKSGILPCRNVISCISHCFSRLTLREKPKVQLDQSCFERIELLRILLAVAVVFVHTKDLPHMPAAFASTKNFSSFIRDLVSCGFGDLAVPTFFLIAGYFFFFNFTRKKKWYLEKFKTRFKTLVIPFLFWTSVFGFSYPFYKIISSISESQNVVPLLAHFFSFEYFDSIFGLTIRMPLLFPFWFIRDLVIVIAFSPVICFLCKKFSFLYLILLFFSYFSNLWSVSAIPSAIAIFWFSIGTYFALSGRNIFFADKFGFVFVAFYFIFLFTNTATCAIYSSVTYKVCMAFGVMSFLFVSGKFGGQVKQFLLWAANANFFVYAIHIIGVKIFFHIGERCFSGVPSLLLYFVVPAGIVAFCVVLYKILLRIVPAPLKIITGGR